MTAAATESRANAAPQSQEFSITRVLNAPRDLVWQAYTRPEHLMHWWGPKGFTMLSAKVELRPGGTFHYGMRSPDGHEMWGKWTFREIEAPERLVIIASFSDEAGNIVRHPLSTTWPLEMLSTMTLAEQDGKTAITVTAAPYNATEEERQTFLTGFAGMEQGFGGTFSQLDAYLESVQGGQA